MCKTAYKKKKIIKFVFQTKLTKIVHQKIIRAPFFCGAQRKVAKFALSCMWPCSIIQPGHKLFVLKKRMIFLSLRDLKLIFGLLFHSVFRFRYKIS